MSLFFVSCGPKQIPAWNGKIYAFDVKQKAFVRRQANEVIPDDSVEAAQMFGIKQQDLLDLLNTYANRPDCE